MKLSLSTNWCNRRIESGEEIAEKALELGFDELELGFRTRGESVPGFRRMLDRIPVGSVHAFCPVPLSAPYGHPELYTLASFDDEARAMARFQVKRSVEFAADIGADVVVLHAGRIAFDTVFRRDFSSQTLTAARRNVDAGDAKYAKLLARARKVRDARAAKMMVVSYPNNPTTALAPDRFYHELIAFAKEYDIVVLHDNAYSELVYDGRTCGSFLRFPGAKEVGVEFNSLSKTYGLAGARIGFCIGNADVVGAVKNLKSNIDYGMFLPVQKAAIAAITGDQSCVAVTRAAYERRRDVLIAGMNEIGWKMEPCAGTMFVWTKIPEAYESSYEFAMELVSRAGVMVTPGSAFGPGGEGHVRLALVQDEEQIRQAVDAIAASGVLNGKE